MMTNWASIAIPPRWMQEANDCTRRSKRALWLRRDWQRVHASHYSYARDLVARGDLRFAVTVQEYAAEKSHLCRARLGVEEYTGP